MSWIEPMAFNVVVELDPKETTTKGGIILPDSKTERDRLACEEGTLIAIAPLAFSYGQWPEGTQKPQVGDRVMVNKFAGMIREHGGKDYRIVEDKSLVAVLREA
jgi:co-chaperonin GroES (HSP10)